MNSIVELKPLFNNNIEEDIIDKVFYLYKDKKIERRIQINPKVDYIIKKENLNIGKLVEEGVKHYLETKYKKLRY